jgi:hypothetical protein
MGVLRYLPLTLALSPLFTASAQENRAAANRVLAGLDSTQMRTHLAVLAHDSMEGRAPGTRGGRAAGDYIESKFREWNLEPAGDSGTYFHHFHFDVIRNTGSSLRFNGDSLRFGVEQVGTTVGPTELASISASLVFAGYGISSASWDDYGGQDLKGKIAIVIGGVPRRTPKAALPADADSRAYKTAQAARHGAVGTIVIHHSELIEFPWRVISQYWSEGHIAHDSSRDTNPLPSFWISREGAEHLLRGSRFNLAQLIQRADSGAGQPLDLGIRVDLSVRNRVRSVDARNVAGIVRGRGPNADEFVVIGGHYDHLGIGPALDGDSIYNGAEDNAGGTAQLLTVAEAFARSGTPPERSLLFIGFDAEEIGLLGAQAFVRRPTVPLANQVAMINLDAANLYGATRDIAALGLQESSLDGVFRRAAQAEGLTVPPSQPDSIEAFYLRSDQLPFARAGIPAIFLFLGWDFVGRTPAWALEQWNRYFAERYHRPDDEWQSWFSMEGALQQARVVTRMAMELANAPERPRWYETSRFHPR